MGDELMDGFPRMMTLEEKGIIRERVSAQLRNGQFPNLFDLYCYITYPQDLAIEEMQAARRTCKT